MKFCSPAWDNGDALPARHAAGRLLADGSVVGSDNLSPPLAWSDLPAGTRSLALLCHDFDAPAVPVGAVMPVAELAAQLPRRDQFHWVLVDLPPLLTGLAEGQWRRRVLPPGESDAAPGAGGARLGLIDCAGRPVGDAATSLRCVGYDGPFPPPDDPLVHHCLFTLYALDTPRLPLPGRFTGQQARAAMAGHVLGAATLSGTYTLNRALQLA